MTAFAQKRLPSLRIRQPSRSKRPSEAAVFQRRRRQASRLVFFGIEARKMLSDNLVGRVALDALSSRIPAGDIAFRVKHVDRVVIDALNESRNCSSLRFRTSSATFRSEIAGNLRKADKVAVGIPDRIDDDMRPNRSPSLRTRQPSASNRPSWRRSQARALAFRGRGPPPCRTVRSVGRGSQSRYTL